MRYLLWKTFFLRVPFLSEVLLRKSRVVPFCLLFIFLFLRFLQYFLVFWFTFTQILVEERILQRNTFHSGLRHKLMTWPSGLAKLLAKYCFFVVVGSVYFRSFLRYHLVCTIPNTEKLPTSACNCFRPHQTAYLLFHFLPLLSFVGLEGRHSKSLLFSEKQITFYH